MNKIKKIDIKNTIISITKIEEEDYICLTDMAKAKDGDNRAADVIKNWIRTRTTIEFLGTWETMYNPNFKNDEFNHFKMEAGLPTFVLSPKKWAEKHVQLALHQNPADMEELMHIEILHLNLVLQSVQLSSFT